MNLTSDDKGDKKGFSKCIDDKWNTRENVDPFLKETGDLVIQEVERDDVLNAFFVCLY